MRMAELAALSLMMASSTVLTAESPPTIDALAWMAGSWQGSGIAGAPAHEVYSPPAAGQMVGHFRQLRPDGSVLFYELITLSVSEGKLRYRVKHFDPDLQGWEDRNESQMFILIPDGAHRWVSPELRIERLSRDRMRIIVRIEKAAGRAETLTFEYARQPEGRRLL